MPHTVRHCDGLVNQNSRLSCDSLVGAGDFLILPLLSRSALPSNLLFCHTPADGTLLNIRTCMPDVCIFRMHIEYACWMMSTEMEAASNLCTPAAVCSRRASVLGAAARRSEDRHPPPFVPTCRAGKAGRSSNIFALPAGTSPTAIGFTGPQSCKYTAFVSGGGNRRDDEKIAEPGSFEAAKEMLLALRNGRCCCLYPCGVVCLLRSRGVGRVVAQGPPVKARSGAR